PEKLLLHHIALPAIDPPFSRTMGVGGFGSRTLLAGRTRGTNAGESLVASRSRRRCAHALPRRRRGARAGRMARRTGGAARPERSAQRRRRGTPPLPPSAGHRPL